MFNRTFDRRVHLFLAVLFGSLTVGLCFGLYALWPANVERGYSPEQPIAFSHALHAGSAKYYNRAGELVSQLQIPCLYCHTQATEGPHATTPPLSTCMNCHSEVRPTVKEAKRDEHEHVIHDAEGNPVFEEKLHPGVETLVNAYENGESIRWIKVHDLADFVYFDHSRHLAAGIDCVSCHGEVGKMERVERVYSLKMAWCLKCHRQPPEANTSPEYASRGHKGPTHCSACHR